MVFCPAEPLGSTGTPLPASMQPRETASTEETLPWGGRAREDTGLEADAFESNLWLYYDIPKYFIY